MTANLPSDHQSLHPRLARLVDVLQECRAQLLAAAESVPEGDRNRRPAVDRWSAGEVLAHLVKVESSCGRLFSVKSRELRESGAAGESEVDAAGLVREFERFELDTRKRPAPAPAMVSPDDAAEFNVAVAALAQSRERLLGAIAKANGLALATVSAPHPRLGTLNLYEWLLMIARHEQRHAEQLVEIRDSLAASGH